MLGRAAWNDQCCTIYPQQQSGRVACKPGFFFFGISDAKSCEGMITESVACTCMSDHGYMKVCHHLCSESILQPDMAMSCCIMKHRSAKIVRCCVNFLL